MASRVARRREFGSAAALARRRGVTPGRLPPSVSEVSPEHPRSTEGEDNHSTQAAESRGNGSSFSSFLYIHTQFIHAIQIMTGRGCLQEGTLLDGEVAASQPTSTAAAPTSSTAAPAFTLLPLGTGGGPFESDLSAYLLKPASSRWASGCISLEAGSGIGALAELLGKPSGHALWEQFELGPAGDHGEPWMAGKVMETMRSYLITHACVRVGSARTGWAGRLLAATYFERSTDD